MGGAGLLLLLLLRVQGTDQNALPDLRMSEAD